MSGQTSLGGGGEHAWNIVKINGRNYYLDVVWNLASRENGFRCYDYFNLTDSAIAVDHFDYRGTPICSDRKENYFEMNGLEATSERQIKKLIKSQIQNEKREIYYRLTSKTWNTMDYVARKSIKYALDLCSSDFHG